MIEIVVITILSLTTIGFATLSAVLAFKNIENKNKIENQKQNIVDLTNSLRSSEHLVSELRVDLTKAQIGLKETTHHLEEANAALNESRTMYEELDDAVDEMVEEAQKAKGAVSKAQSQISDYQKIVNSYEALYNDTKEDVERLVSYLDSLMQREMIASDPDIQNLYNVLKATKEIFGQYLNALNTEAEVETTKTEDGKLL